MNSFLLSLAALLILALSAAFAVPHFVDWNAYRGVFEAHAAKVVGRDVRVGGDVRLTLLPVPKLSFEDVRIADQDGGFQTPLVAAGSFTVWLSVPPLLSGVIEAREVAIARPVLNLRVAEDGTGNWAGLGASGYSLPLMPSDITLDQVDFTDARVTVARGAGEAELSLDDVDATLSARTLDGPYRLSATFRLAGVQRELRLSTAQRTADGNLRIKLQTRDLAGSDSYSLDGVLSRFASEPRFEGALHARFAAEDGRLSEEVTAGVDPDHDAVAEIKAELDAGLTGAAFDDVEIALRHKDRPQTVTGRLRADWSRGVSAQGELAARWLDLDALSDTDGRMAPPALLAMLGRAVLPHLSSERDIRLAVSVEQAVLGGDVARDLRVEAATEDHALRIERLSGRLPGDNDIRLSGVLRSEAGEPAFQGHLDLAGKRLSRILRWTGTGDAALDAAAEAGDYRLQARIVAAPGYIAVEDVEGSALGSAFTGALAYRGGARPDFSLAFDSDRLDLERLLGEEASIAMLAGLVAPPARAETDGVNSASWMKRARARVNLRVGTVTLPRLGDTALTARLNLQEGTLDVEELRLVADPDLVIHGQGRLTGVGGRPDGRIDVNVDAADDGALEALSTFLAIPPSLASGPRLRALSPLQMLVSVQSTDDDRRALEMRVGGLAGGSDVSVTVGIQGALEAIEEGRLDLVAAMSNRNGRALLAQAFPSLRPADWHLPDETPGSLRLSARGVPASELTTELLLEAGPLHASFSGTSALSQGRLALAGRAALTMPEAATALRLTGKMADGVPAGTGLELGAQLSKTEAVFELAELSGRVATQPVTGQARADFSGTQPRFDVDLRTQHVRLADLLVPLLDWDAGGLEAIVGASVTGTPSHWPNRRFDATLLESFDGHLNLHAERLDLEGALGLEEAALEASLAGGTLTVGTLKGTLYDGAFDASATLAKRGSGVGFLGEARATGVRLERITATQGRPPLASGQADLDISVTGEGLTPGGVVAGLAGEGRLGIGRGIIHGLAPRALAPLVEQAGATEQTGDNLVTRVAARLEQDDFVLAPVEVPFRVRNGTARFEKATLTGEAGEAVVSSYLDLASLRLDSEWILAPAPSRPGEPAPQVAMIFAGSLLDFGRIAPEIDTQALERYITMRRMERDVQTLEELDLRGGGPEAGGAAPAEEGSADDTPQASMVAPAVPAPQRTRLPEPPPTATPEIQRGPGPSAPPAPPPVASRPPAPARTPSDTPPVGPAVPPVTQPALPWLAPEARDARGDDEPETGADGWETQTEFEADPSPGPASPARDRSRWQSDIWDRQLN